MNESTFSKNLRYYRKLCNLTQKDLGKKVGKKESTVRMWELGKSEPTLSTLVKLSKALNASIDELAGVEKR